MGSTSCIRIPGVGTFREYMYIPLCVEKCILIMESSPVQGRVKSLPVAIPKVKLLILKSDMRLLFVVYFPNCNRHTANKYVFHGVQFMVISLGLYSCDLWS